MNIIKVFENAFKRMEEKNWDCIYVLVDIHGTIFEPSYNNEEKFLTYPYAEDELHLMSESKKVKLILWSSTKFSWTNDYMLALTPWVYFDYVNGNPEVKVTNNDPEQMSFDKKPYFNVGLDDKFGFEPETDWEEIYEYLKTKEL